jgi:HEAT repeat protein
MKNSIFAWVAALVLGLPGIHLRAASSLATTTNSTAAAEEQKLIAVLQSNAAPRAKDAACARLKIIGTEKSVPALALLLTDKDLSHSARYALEPMQSPKAGKALLNALSTTHGLTQAGIINSLAYRREAKAIPELKELVKSPDAQVATAAAHALGRIGGPKAIAALKAVSADTSGAVHGAVLDSLLRCAVHLNEVGRHADALALFKQLYQSQNAGRFRVAAYRGMIQASGTNALPLVVSAISGNEGAAQMAALQTVRDLHAPGTTVILGALIPNLDSGVQMALIGELAQRDDPAAITAVASAAGSQDSQVRIAALTALGTLGDATMVSLLAQRATSTNAPEQDAARLALVQLRRGDCSETILAQLTSAAPEVQAELARAIADRRDTNAIPRLLDLAGSNSDSARRAALQALGSLCDQPQLPAMVALIRTASTPASREQAADALASTCRGIKERHGAIDLEPVVQEMNNGSVAVRVALLPVCGAINDPKTRAALRKAIDDPDPELRSAAIRALCDTTDAELSPEVLKLAREVKEENFRTLAIRAAVRLTTQEEGSRLSNADRLAALQSLLSMPLTDAQKRIVLSGVGQIKDAQSLKLALPFLGQDAVRNEAAQAIISVAAALPYTEREPASAALKMVQSVSDNETTLAAAAKALADTLAVNDYILAWQVSGPYFEDGKDYHTLFDTPFPPETGDGTQAKWRSVNAGPDPKSPWVIDLLGTFGGEQRVGYARAWVYSPERAAARLEFGSDDGIKIWLNGQVIHRNNTYRGFSAGSDVVNATFNAGWNPLLLKITQLNGGWAFSARVVTAEGRHFDGLKFSADPRTVGQLSPTSAANTTAGGR